MMSAELWALKAVELCKKSARGVTQKSWSLFLFFLSLKSEDLNPERVWDVSRSFKKLKGVELSADNYPLKAIELSLGKRYKKYKSFCISGKSIWNVSWSERFQSSWNVSWSNESNEISLLTERPLKSLFFLSGGATWIEVLKNDLHLSSASAMWSETELTDSTCTHPDSFSH